MVKINLLSKQHLNRFIELLRKTDKIQEKTGNIDVEYGVAYYLLAADEDIYEKAKPYITNDGINFKKMISKQDFSSGQLLVVKVAANLFQWTYKEDVSPIDIIGSLDDKMFEIYICAMLLRRNGSLKIGNIVNQMDFSKN